MNDVYLTVLLSEAKDRPGANTGSPSGAASGDEFCPWCWVSLLEFHSTYSFHCG
jgi:hypothetical protein